MTLMRVPPEWWDSGVTEAVGAEAVVLHHCALAWSVQHGRDGLIPRSRVMRLTPFTDPLALAERLVWSGYWQKLEDGDYLLTEDKGLLSFQYTSEQVAAHRKADRERQARRRNPASHGVTPAVSNAMSHGTLRTPSPTPSPSPSLPQSSSLRSSEDAHAQARGSGSVASKDSGASAPKKRTRKPSFRDAIPGEDEATLKAKYGDPSKWQSHAG